MGWALEHLLWGTHMSGATSTIKPHPHLLWDSLFNQASLLGNEGTFIWLAVFWTFLDNYLDFSFFCSTVELWNTFSAASKSALSADTLRDNHFLYAVNFFKISSISRTSWCIEWIRPGSGPSGLQKSSPSQILLTVWSLSRFRVSTYPVPGSRMHWRPPEVLRQLSAFEEDQDVQIACRASPECPSPNVNTRNWWCQVKGNTRLPGEQLLHGHFSFQELWNISHSLVLPPFSFGRIYLSWWLTCSAGWVDENLRNINPCPFTGRQCTQELLLLSVPEWDAHVVLSRQKLGSYREVAYILSLLGAQEKELKKLTSLHYFMPAIRKQELAKRQHKAILN